MALNPIVFTEIVVQSFLRYQFTTYAFADSACVGRCDAGTTGMVPLALTRRFIGGLPMSLRSLRMGSRPGFGPAPAVRSVRSAGCT